MGNEIYTVGHSTHTGERFLHLLGVHRITAIADVRSTPFSRRNPQFNRERLAAALKVNDIDYAFLGKELGARSDDESCYVNDKVSYARLAGTRLFESGIDRVARDAGSHTVALMCAEKEPLDCHRTILVARRLVHDGFRILHILADGSTETHDEAMQRLSRRFKLDAGDLFGTSHGWAQAYDEQAERIAFDRKRHGKR